MIKVLFICHGNICRSPMAEYILKDMVRKKGMDDRFFIASAAVSREEIGNDVYPPARRCLTRHGIPCPSRRAVQMTKADLDRFDWILYMERYNESGLRRILGDLPQKKVRRLLDFSSRPRDVDDPWYTGDFETAFSDIQEGCAAFLNEMEGCL